MRPILPAVAIVVSLALALAACGGGSKKSSGSATGTTTSTKHTATFTPPKAIATVYDTTLGDRSSIPFQVSVYDLRRDGPFLVLDFGIRCLLPANSGCSVLDAFAPGYVPPSQYKTDQGGVPTGIKLVDPSTLKEYLPVRDAQGRAYVSTLAPGDTELSDSLVHLQWARYPLPAAGTTALDVALPQGGPVIPNVPISNGSGPTAGGRYVAAQPFPFSQPPGSTNAAGLTLPTENLISTSGNPAGSDSESSGQAELTLQSDVLFKFDKSNLTPKARTILRSVAQQIKARARGPVQVTGYTDSIGSDAVNLPLSQARARSVVTALTPLTAGVTYNARGLGSADPVAPNTKPDGSDNPIGRALNRRVTIVFPAAAQRPTPPAPASAGGPAPQAGSVTFRGVVNRGETYRAGNAALYRDGNLLVLTMTVGCASSSDDNACDPTFDLAGLPTVPPVSLATDSDSGFDPPATHSISGFYLLDPATGTEYIPVRGNDQGPVTTGLTEQMAAPSDYRVWSYFPAPPSTTTSLTLVSPGGSPRLGPISIAAGPPPTP